MKQTRFSWNPGCASGSLAWTSALLLAALPCVGMAQNFTLKQALDYPFPYGLIAATHGDRIAQVFNLRGSRNVWVADGPAFSARQVTHCSDDDMPIASLRPTPNGVAVMAAHFRRHRRLLRTDTDEERIDQGSSHETLIRASPPNRNSGSGVSQ